MLRLWLAAVVIALAAGWFGHARYRAGVDAREALQQSETARETERLAGRNMTRISDALTRDRLASDRRAADTAGRLQQLAEATATSGPAGCPGRNDDPRPAAGLISDATRGDLVALAADADAVADRLRACQAGRAAGG